MKINVGKTEVMKIEKVKENKPLRSAIETNRDVQIPRYTRD